MHGSGMYENVSSYEFLDFNVPSKGLGHVTEFKYKNIDRTDLVVEQQKKSLIEQKLAKSSGFNIDDIVQNARGIKAEENRAYENKISEETSKRVDKIKEDAFRKGFEQGVEEGRGELLSRMVEKADENLTSLASMISEVVQTQEKIVKQKQKEIYALLKTLARWIVLRELKEDGKYIERLLEKLVIELGSRSSLLVQVNQKNFEEMPEILERVQKKIGEISNVRVEIDYDVEERGIVLESDKGIIDGNLEIQLAALDKLFAEVGISNE